MSQLISVVVPCFNDSRRSIDLANALGRQRLPRDLLLEVVIVDDGSDSHHASALTSATLENPFAQILTLPQNEGRSSARNRGAAMANGDIIVFVDCDCMPVRSDFLLKHFSAFLQPNVVASIGDVVADPSSFWGRYQNAASVRRRRTFLSGLSSSGSSQNIAVKRISFNAIGGFDEHFTTYGFEDRDLFARIAGFGEIVWTIGAEVKHLDQMATYSVLQKMYEAGGKSSLRFSGLHPEDYRKAGYARLDSRLHPSLALLAKLSRTTLPFVMKWIDKSIQIKLPMILKLKLVRFAAALSFMAGTAKKD